MSFPLYLISLSWIRRLELNLRSLRENIQGQEKIVNPPLTEHLAKFIRGPQRLLFEFAYYPLKYKTIDHNWDVNNYSIVFFANLDHDFYDQVETARYESRKTWTFSIIVLQKDLNMLIYENRAYKNEIILVRRPFFRSFDL